MNGATHFFTGYLIARALNNENDRFESFFLGFAALIPDFDVAIGFFVPTFQHAVVSHTILGGLLFAMVFLLGSYALLHGFVKDMQIPFTRLLALTLIGLTSHLILDIFTFQVDCATTMAHLYFWPVWNQSFHMNCLWSGVTYLERTLVEVIYSGFLVVVILVYDWGMKKHNPFLMFAPHHWWAYKSAQITREKVPKSTYMFLGIFLVIVAFSIIDYIPG